MYWLICRQCRSRYNLLVLCVSSPYISTCARFLQAHEHVHWAPHKPDFNILTLIFIATQHRGKTPTQPNSALGWHTLDRFRSFVQTQPFALLQGGHNINHFLYYNELVHLLRKTLVDTYIFIDADEGFLCKSGARCSSAREIASIGMGSIGGDAAAAGETTRVVAAATLRECAPRPSARTPASERWSATLQHQPIELPSRLARWRPTNGRRTVAPDTPHSSLCSLHNSLSLPDVPF